MRKEFIEKFADLKEKDFAEQVAPTSGSLNDAVREAAKYCFNLNRMIAGADKAFSTGDVKKFYRYGLDAVGAKLSAIAKLGATFRNESLSITRDLFEIIVDLWWVWHYYEHNREVAEKICSQFCLNGPARFIEDFDSILKNYTSDPFVKKHYTKERLEDYLEKAKRRVGSYYYKKNWRTVKGNVEYKDTLFQAKASKAKQVIKTFTKFDVNTLEQNWIILCSYTHWDSQQTQFEDSDAEQLIFNRNLNATLVNVFVLIEFGYHILEIRLPNKIKASALRVIM